MKNLYNLIEANIIDLFGFIFSRRFEVNFVYFALVFNLIVISYLIYSLI